MPLKQARMGSGHTETCKEEATYDPVKQAIYYIDGQVTEALVHFKAESWDKQLV